jgi:hypothetical protein
MSDAATIEAPAPIGHNRPPDPFGAISAHVEDLYTEAKNWADGTPITTQAQADEVSRLIDELRKAAKAADDARIAEKKPLDDQVAAVQAKWGALIADTKGKRGLTVLALEACKAALRPWLEAIEDENRRKAEEARQAARRAADEAAEAMQAARATSDLEARERAEELAAQAKAAETSAARAESAKAHAIGGERAMGLRDNWIPKLVDGQAALRHYWQANRPALEDFALGLARVDVRSGKRHIPGFEVVNDRRV